ncbi:hypothetical protein ABW636_11650 [Aquimarina sp. 2201CG1-2-11]|uniref:hypothetical protein n=1 Tax=Aquimarina discodermiae TaxID=3231043 RepID=UPI0034618788
MKKIVIIIVFLCSIPKINAQDVYSDAITAASYAYSHSKKAHGANNVYHTQEYADKAIEAFEKVETLSDQCNCTEANETAYQARVDMESSLEQDTYERSRYFAKRAKELGAKVLEQLTTCQAVAGNYSDSSEESDLADATQEVADKQKELEEKRRQLEIEQQKLEQQIAEQNRMKAEFEARRAEELKKQSEVKLKAEQALDKLQNALQELSVVLNNKSEFGVPADYVRSEKELKNESLDDTKNFYVNRAKELTKTAMQQFASFNDIEN